MFYEYSHLTKGYKFDTNVVCASTTKNCPFMGVVNRFTMKKN